MTLEEKNSGRRRGGADEREGGREGGREGREVGVAGSETENALSSHAGTV